MKLLIVSRLDRSARAISTIAGYARTGKALGHEVAVFGEQKSGPPGIPLTLSVKNYDFVIFVVYDAPDFPDLPYLAQLLDGVPKDRRVIIDCTGRYNETIRVEHDFNHLEKIDNHQGWEWVEGIQAVSNRVLQPTLAPLRPDVRPFLFHAFDPASVAHPYESAPAAVRGWSGVDGTPKPYGVAYVGHNWQRWTQIRRFFEAIEPLRDRVGPMCLAGWRWDERPEWAIERGVAGVDTDPAFLKKLGVETKLPIQYHEMIQFMGQARFCPVFHRPVFNHLGLVTVRTFETFCADTIPILMLPDNLVDAVYGPAGASLAPGDDVTGRLTELLDRPEDCWAAVLKTRAHLAQHHSYQQRFKELLAILEE